MKKLLFCLAVAASVLTACGRKAAGNAEAPMAVIFETDLGNDVDDALALDLLYSTRFFSSPADPGPADRLTAYAAPRLAALREAPSAAATPQVSALLALEDELFQDA